jgi:hypothetical protein
MIVFDCPACRAELEADLEYAGESISCPSCQHTVVVPAGAIARGSLIAGYRIERHLGSGNLGEVYLAVQLSVERRVALKVLPPALAQNAVLTAAFLREARALARVEHAGVVAVLDAGSDSGCFYLASPLIEGEDLESRLERKGRLAEAEAVHLALGMARVLNTCWETHAAPHLDLKPANILVDVDGQIHLLDLGLTGHLFADPDTLATARHLLITPYVSPEQMEGQATLDFRCDMYALGAVLFHLTTGHPPFHGTVADELVSRLLNESFPPARTVNPELSEELDQLIADLTVKDVRRRPAGWDLVIERLEQMEQASAPPPPKRAQAPRRLVVGKPAPKAAAPGRVIKVKASDPHLHHPVKAKGPSAVPWVIGTLLLLAAGGAYFGLKASRYRTTMETTLASDQAAAQDGSGQEGRQRAAEMVQSARQFVETYPRDLEGGRAQIRAAREALQTTSFAGEMAPELDRLEAELRQREQPAEPAPTPATVAGSDAADAADVAEPTGEPAADDPAESTTKPRVADADAPSAPPVPVGMAALYQAAGRLLNRDYAGAGAQLPAKDDPVQGVDVGALRKELAELPRWTDRVYDGLREQVGQELNLAFRDGPRSLVIRAVNPPTVRAEKVVREGERVIARSAASFRLEELSADEIMRQLHGERGGVAAVMSGLVAYRAGKLSDARAWFNRTTSPWAPLLVHAMDLADAAEMR